MKISRYRNHNSPCRYSRSVEYIDRFFRLLRNVNTPEEARSSDRRVSERASERTDRKEQQIDEQSVSYPCRHYVTACNFHASLAARSVWLGHRFFRRSSEESSVRPSVGPSIPWLMFSFFSKWLNTFCSNRWAWTTFNFTQAHHSDLQNYFNEGKYQRQQQQKEQQQQRKAKSHCG